MLERGLNEDAPVRVHAYSNHNVVSNSVRRCEPQSEPFKCNPQGIGLELE